MDKFLIAPIDNGLQEDLAPWLIPEDAFVEMTNAYVWRGRVRKRFGSRYMGTEGQLSSRLRINLGNTHAVTGDLAGTVPGAIFKVGQMFSIEDQLFTVNTAGAVQDMLQTGTPVPTATYSTTNGAYNFVGGGAHLNKSVYFYPAEPVMGLANLETGTINNQPSFAFDTQFGYMYNTAWNRTGAANLVFHGTNSDFFQSTNWRGATSNVTAFFTTNFHTVNPNGAGTTNDDPIWWTIDGGTNWVPGNDRTTGFATNESFIFSTPAACARLSGRYVKTARIVLPFKGRLILLNTIENSGGAALGTNTHYGNRCRYSHWGSPLYSATNLTAWYESGNVDAAGNEYSGGGVLDAPIQEDIISAEFIRDRLVVFFEQSTWELVYIGAPTDPFKWQKLDKELGSQSLFSTIPFDKFVLTLGNTGFHSCNGANVQSIDEKIPDKHYEIANRENGVKRVAGIRDFYVDMAYWSFPSMDDNTVKAYPDKVFVFNYVTGSWGINEDCITCFGYFEQTIDTTWETTELTWEQYTAAWDSGVMQANFRATIAGNQQGFVFYIEADNSGNAPVAQITDLAIAGNMVTLTIVDHNFVCGEYISIENTNGITLPIGGSYPVRAVDYTNNTVTVYATDIVGVYTGGGTSARVSNYDVRTKPLNPYIKEGSRVDVSKVDFCVLNVPDGKAMVKYYPSSSTVEMVETGAISGTLLGTSVLTLGPHVAGDLETFQSTLWRSIYLQSGGDSIQLRITMNDEQLSNMTTARSDFQLQGFIIYTNRISHV